MTLMKVTMLRVINSQLVIECYPKKVSGIDRLGSRGRNSAFGTISMGRTP
jgi:hypothetical protein